MTAVSVGGSTIMMLKSLRLMRSNVANVVAMVLHRDLNYWHTVLIIQPTRPADSSQRLTPDPASVFLEALAALSRPSASLCMCFYERL